MNEILDLNSYDYALPKELIASEPIMPKSEARLLVYERKSGKISHLKFGDLPEILPDCDMIFNDTKVIKARIYGHKITGAKIELLFNQPLGKNLFNVYIKGSVRIGAWLVFDENLYAQVSQICDDGSKNVAFFQDTKRRNLDEISELNLYSSNKTPNLDILTPKLDSNTAQIPNFKPLNTTEIYSILARIGHVPLPPYIRRDDNADDESWYQSIFAKFDGAVAAPTASLHFDDELISRLKTKHQIHNITLHVGAGTFKGVDVDDISKHKMHSEIYDIPQNTAQILKSDRKICAVGTTVTRTIEHFIRTQETSGKCDIFINLLNPPRRVDFLITNFHLPKSTLIMLVSAFVGLKEVQKIYEQALKERYRFYSYGDGMLIL